MLGLFHFSRAKRHDHKKENCISACSADQQRSAETENMFCHSRTFYKSLKTLAATCFDCVKLCSWRGYNLEEESTKGCVEKNSTIRPNLISSTRFIQLAVALSFTASHHHHDCQVSPAGILTQ